MEKIRCPNPECEWRILDNEAEDSEWTVLEIWDISRAFRNKLQVIGTM